MKKILYSGISKDGRKRYGFVEAASNKEALAHLKKEELNNIELHDDVFTALNRDDLEKLSEKQTELIAEFEIRARYSSNINALKWEYIWHQKFWILIWAGSLIWMWYQKSYTLMFLGLAIALTVPIFHILKIRHVNRYNNLLIACTFGQWDQALALIQRLRRHLKQPEMVFDLDIRQACIVAAKGFLVEALESVSDWKYHFDKTSPGLFEARLAEVYHAGGEYGEYMNMLREAEAKSPESPSALLDLALAEARFGYTERTETLLSRLKIEELPPVGRPYIDWAKGAAARRNKDIKAVTYLESAVNQMMQFNENPSTWIALAMCTGDLAAALIDCGKKDKAKDLAAKVWKILKVHGESRLLKELADITPGEI